MSGERTQGPRSAGRPGIGIVRVAVLTVAVVVAAGCGVWSKPAGPVEVLVGVDVDLTGRGPGVAYGNALGLAAEQINQRGLAGSGWRVALRVLDNRGDPALSAQNLATLTADPHVVAVVTAGCPRCVIEAAGWLSKPVIALSGQEAVAAPAWDRRWVFRLGPNAADDADVLSAAMAQAGVSTVAVIAAGDPYGRDGARWFGQAAARDGLQVTVTVEVPASAGTTQVAEVAASVLAGEPGSPEPDRDGANPDAVLLWLPAPQAAQVAQALRAAGYTGQLYADMVAADELFGPGPLAGARLVATSTAVAAERVAASPAAAARQEWVLHYVSRYGGYQLHSTWAADALLVLANAVARSGSTDPAEIRTHIESTRIDGITGAIRFTPGQHSGLLPGALVVLTATGDRWQ